MPIILPCIDYCFPKMGLNLMFDMFLSFPFGNKIIPENRVGGGVSPPSSHTTVRTVPYTAVQYILYKIFNIEGFH